MTYLTKQKSKMKQVNKTTLLLIDVYGKKSGDLRNGEYKQENGSNLLSVCLREGGAVYTTTPTDLVVHPNLADANACSSSCRNQFQTLFCTACTLHPLHLGVEGTTLAPFTIAIRLFPLYST